MSFHESILRDDFCRAHKSDYREIADRRAEIEATKKAATQNNAQRRQLTFPLARQQPVELVDSTGASQRSPIEANDGGRPSIVDRGYYVTSSQFQGSFIITNDCFNSRRFKKMSNFVF